MRRIFQYSILMILCAMPARAGDHSEYVSDHFPDARSVTAECLTCHPDQGVEFMETAHWKWKGPSPFVSGHETENALGKLNLINNF